VARSVMLGNAAMTAYVASSGPRHMELIPREAACPVAALADPDRGWDAIVIGEYEQPGRERAKSCAGQLAQHTMNRTGISQQNCIGGDDSVQDHRLTPRGPTGTVHLQTGSLGG
jgi:hypothetical protein